MTTAVQRYRRGMLLSSVRLAACFLVLFTPIRLTIATFWCPNECLCSEPAKIIDCSSRNLKYVPKVPDSIVRLYLGDNSIETLLSDVFSGLHKLTYLIISNNKITDISEDAFHGLSSLKYLVLDSNQLRTLPKGLLLGLYQLRTVSIAKNRLSSIPSGFLIYSRSLTLLNLQHNHISEISKGTFQSLSRLHSLYLQYNELTNDALNEIKHCSSLEILRLDHNKLSSFHPLEGFPSLFSLHLAGNDISHVSSPLLPNCSKLQLLDLSNNSMAAFSQGTFSGCQQLQRLKLSDNRFTSLHTILTSDSSSLHSLQLNNNFIKSLNISISWNTSPSLRHLYLYGNNVSTVSIEFLEPLRSLASLHLDSLRCTCSLLPLVQWLESSKVMGIKCIMKNRLIHIRFLIDYCNITNSSSNSGSPLTTDILQSKKETSFKKKEKTKRKEKTKKRKMNNKKKSHNKSKVCGCRADKVTGIFSDGLFLSGLSCSQRTHYPFYHHYNTNGYSTTISRYSNSDDSISPSSVEAKVDSLLNIIVHLQQEIKTLNQKVERLEEIIERKQ